MALAHDTIAQSPAELASATTQTITYTPLATCFGIIVLITQVGTADEVSGVTYGGVAMTRIGFSTGNGGAAYFYHLGSGIPAGAQSCIVTSTGTAPKWTVVHGAAGGISSRTRAFMRATRTSASLANPVIDYSGPSNTGLAWPAFGGIAYYAAFSAGVTVPTVFQGTNSATHAFAANAGVYNRNLAGNNDAVTCGFTKAAAAVADGLMMVEEEYIPDFAIADRVT